MKAIHVSQNLLVTVAASLLLNLAQVARADIICQKKDSGEPVFMAITLTPKDPQNLYDNPVVAVLNTGTKKISLTGFIEKESHRIDQYSLIDSDGNEMTVVRTKCEFTRPGCTSEFFSSWLSYGQSKFLLDCRDTELTQCSASKRSR